jgi:FKBP-type peptidyl-prolyl cis-trans isomerase
MRFNLLTAALAGTLGAALLLSACGQRGTTPHTTKSAKDFLASNAHAPGIVVLPSGLQYKIVNTGPKDGPHPAKGDEIKLEYSGSLIDGTVFDSTTASGQPAVMKLDSLVPGWMEALPKMRPGDEWLLYLPPKLGYGPEGHPPAIPPDSVLVFDVKLIGVLKTSEGVKFAASDADAARRIETVGKYRANT